MRKDNYIIVKDRHPRISEVLNDCISLCVPTSKDEPLSSILQKLCGKLTSITTRVQVLEDMFPLEVGEDFEISVGATDCLTLSGEGTEASPIVGELIISEAEDNILECTEDGLYVPPTEIPDIPEEYSPSIIAVDSISDLATIDTTIVDTVIVENVGVYKFSSASLTNNGYQTVTAIGGFWVLKNSAQIKMKQPDEYQVMAEVVPGSVTALIEPTTKAGALTTAVITDVGGYDNYAVTGGTDHTNYIRFDNQKIQDNFRTLKLRIKIDTLGATSPIVGIGLFGVAAANDTAGSGISTLATINLLTKSVAIRSSTCSGTVSPSSSAGTFVSSGDILSLSLKINPILNRKQFVVLNETTGAYASYEAATSASCSGHTLGQRMMLVLTDGTYTVLEHKAYSSVPQRNLFAIIGDSYGCGLNVQLNDTIAGELQEALPEYHIACYAAGSAYLITMATHQIPDILKLKPKYVLIMTVLSVFYGYYDDADANQTQYDTYMTDILNAITSYGGIPVFVKWQSGSAGFLNNNAATYDTKVSSHIVSYPTSIRLDLSASALALNSSGHPTAADNKKISDKIVELLRTEGAI